MATKTNARKITLSSSRDIPFDKLMLSQSNVRHIKAGVSIEELAEDIARRTLLQSLTVRPVLNDAGKDTGLYEIPAGGRRYRALELLVKQKRLAKNAPVPCVIREGGIAEEDSLAENVQRALLHPLDQFRAFQALREKGPSEEEIAASFFVSAAVVKQRLKLASVSQKLLNVYAEDGMTLDQLMAFTVNGDHERQNQVWEAVQRSWSKEPYQIRRMLTEGTVRVADKRALFIGLDAYIEAGGAVLHDLFVGDDGGWHENVGLVERLVAEKLEREAEAVRAEGWKWIESAPDFPYGHIFRLRRLCGNDVPLNSDEEATREALLAEQGGLDTIYADVEELPDDVDARLGEIEAELTRLEERPVVYDPAEVARAGAFVSIDGAGNLRIERGYVRPEDELPVEPEADAASDGTFAGGREAVRAVAARAEHEGDGVDVGPAIAEPEEDEGFRPIPDRLMAELTAHRTLALREALGENADVAFLAALHALCLKLFYTYAPDSCLELDIRNVAFGAQAPGLADTVAAQMLDTRHQNWATAMPKRPEELWDALAEFDADSQRALFAHCVAMSVNATFDTYSRRPRALAHADRLAQAVDLDMVAAGWAPTVETFLGRVTKAQILQAVREAKGERAAQLINHLRKGEMADKAQELLAGSGWLPEPLRTLGQMFAIAPEAEAEAQTGAGTFADAPSSEERSSGPRLSNAALPSRECAVPSIGSGEERVTEAVVELEGPDKAAVADRLAEAGSFGEDDEADPSHAVAAE